MATDKKFLITYDSGDGIYRFFSEDKAGYQLALSAFGVRELEPITLETEDIFYIREITDTGLKTVVLDVNVPEPDEGAESVVIELEDIKDYIVDYSVDNSFVMIDEEVVLNALSVEGGRAKITLVAPIPESIRVQLSYYSAIPLKKDVSYNLTINEEELSILCQIRNEDTCYLGDWNYFMGDDSPEEPSSEIIVIEASEHSKDISDSVNTVITYSDNGKQYKITFGEKQEDETFTSSEYILSAKELVMSETSAGSAAYVGNLSLYKDDLENTGEPFCIITIEHEAAEEEVIDSPYETWLFVEELTEPQEREYSLLIEDFNLIIIPELAGAALVSFGRKETENDKTVLKDNYGIGINSSDNGLTLPERAISLFETELDNNNENKIKFSYRGILGTLPDTSLMGNSVNSKIYPNMAKTQGIYTDNMYIGNKDQYVAFYKEKNTGEPRLDVKGTLYVGDDTLDKIVKIQDGSILLGDSNGFHILIDGDKSHTNTYGLGFYEINERVAYVNEQKLYIPYTVVLEGMDVGDKKWRWELQPDTENLTLKWLGGDE